MGSLVAAMTTLLLLLCSLFPLAACLSLSASTDTQFLHATVDWSTGALKGVQYLPAQARYLSMNAPCFLEPRRTGECDDGDDACSILMCRDKTEAFVAVCNLTSYMDPSNVFLDSSSGQLFAVRDDITDHTSVYSMDITTEKREVFNEALDETSVAYDAARHLWLGLNNTGGGKFGPLTGINMFSSDADSMQKVKAFPTGAIPQSWIDQFPEDTDFLTTSSIILEGGKLHASFINIQDEQTGAYFSPLVTMDASTGKLLAAVKVQFPTLDWHIDAMNPSR